MVNALKDSIVYAEYSDDGSIIRLIGKGVAKDFKRRD